MPAPARQTDTSRAIARLQALGSQEIPRHVGKAVSQTVEGARDWMRAATKRTLGSRVQGPAGLMQRHEVPDYTVNAIRSTNVEYRKLSADSPIPTGEVYVAATQGQHGEDQSAFLKFQFGAGPQTRKPGDVGLSNSRILVWRPRDLVLTAKLGGINPYDPSGRQPQGLLGKLGAMAKDPYDGWGKPSKADVMAATARKSTFSPLRSLDDRLAMAHGIVGEAALERGIKDAHRQAGGRRSLHSLATLATKRINDIADNHPWGVFRAPDAKSGIETFKARPWRERDPAGGKHAIRRADGSVGYMPNMISVAPEYGEAGRMVGPRALFAARSSVQYDPQLEAPWREMQARGDEQLAANLAAEVAHAGERRNPGRSF